MPNNSPPPLVVYIDVDDTLVRWAGSKCIPRTLVIEKVKERAANGERLFLWSRAGDEHAKRVADELGISEIFEAILPKPQHVIDDEPLQDWDFCSHEAPW